MNDMSATEIVQERTLKALYRDSERESVIQKINPASVANWYLVRCAPGRDLTAMRWLSRRRFGVFLPLAGIRRVLPGWLGVYAFDIDEMQERILGCPGVLGILRCHKGKPFAITDGFIRNLRELTWISDGGIHMPSPRPKAKKSKKPRVVGRDRNKLSKLKRAAKKADRAGELSRAVDIRAQITALRQKFSAPRGVAA